MNTILIYIINRAGKTRCVYETFCQRYGIYLTLNAGDQKKNMGSGDLDYASTFIEDYLEKTDHRKNSITALAMTRSVLAARIFVLEKLLATHGKMLTPKIWLLLQLLPQHVNVRPSDFWVKMSTIFIRSKNSDLSMHISDMVRSIQQHFDHLKINQTKIPIAIDEAQEAIDMYPNMFHSTTSADQRRSFFTILLRTAMDQSDMCTIISGTGLRLDDLKNDTGSTIGKDTNITTKDFVSITCGFNDINKMEQFITPFIGPLEQQQMKLIFSYLQGRHRFVVSFLDVVFRNIRNRTSRDNNAIRCWRDDTIDALIGQLADSIERMQKERSVWPTVEKIIIQYHVFSKQREFGEEAAFAVEVGFAQLNRVENASTDVIAVAGLSEPLAVKAYIHRNPQFGTLNKRILEMMHDSYNEQEKGKLFERYIINPLLEMFGSKKRRADGTPKHHQFIEQCIKDNKDLLQLLSHGMSVHGSDTSVFYEQHGDEEMRSFYGQGDLLSYLQNPKETFYKPEDAASPDIVFVIEIQHPDDDAPILIPVFVQAKLALIVNNVKAAIGSVTPESFYRNKRPDMQETCKTLRDKVLLCLKTKYTHQFNPTLSSIGILVAFPAKINYKRTNNIIYNGDEKTLTIIIDGVNAKKIIPNDDIKELSRIKLKRAVIDRQPTIVESWLNQGMHCFICFFVLCLLFR